MELKLSKRAQFSASSQFVEEISGIENDYNTGIMIHVENLNYCYPNQLQDTLKGISFTIGKGEIYGFLGPSGAGKSTTQKILIKLLSGYRGDIQVMNKNLNSWHNEYYNHIGVGFELPNHYGKLTGLENLKLFASFYENSNANLMELLDKVGLSDAANKKTEDYSKGMKMRLNFVRALIHNPDILFFIMMEVLLMKREVKVQIQFLGNVKKINLKLK